MRSWERRRLVVVAIESTRCSRTMKFAARLLLFVATTLVVVGGEPTTLEQRKKVVGLTRTLEQVPFGDSADAGRAWATRLLDDASDIKLRINANMLRELSKASPPDRLPIFAQFVLGHATFALEHPERVNDEVACTTAAFTSALHVYRKAVERNPANRFAFFDALNEHERAGTLTKRVEQLVAERKPAERAK
jgi:hypothetical protein